MRGQRHRPECAVASLGMPRIAGHPQELERDKEGLYPVSEKAWPCQHCDFRPVAFGTMRMIFCCFQPPYLLGFVTGALGN